MSTPKIPGQSDAPDPAVGGKIHNIVQSAHLWGGNGDRPQFNKIKHVLLTKHPGVIGTAFGGDPNVAAAWIVDNWNAVNGVTYQCQDGSRSPQCWRTGGKKKGEVSMDEDAFTTINLGWLPSNVKQSDLDKGDFAWCSTDGKTCKLPYKIHGVVNEAGWKAAWSRLPDTDLTGGPNEATVRAKLLKDKPKDVTANPNLSNDDGTPMVELSDSQVESLITRDGITHELFFASPAEAPAEDGDLLWKDVLKTGTWKVHPNTKARSEGSPFNIDKNDLAEIVDNFNDGAWEHVTVPKTHEDKLDENTGFVKKLLIKPDPERKGHKILRAGIKFTDPLIKQKVLDGSIANVSCGLDYAGMTRTTDGKKYSKVMKHLALTNAPFVKGLKPFGSEDAVNASEDATDWDGSLVFEDTAPKVRQEDNAVKSFLQKVKDLLLSHPNEPERVVKAFAGLEIPDGLTAEEAEAHLSEMASSLDEGSPDESDGGTPSDGGGSADGSGSENPDSGNEGGEITMSEENKNKDGKETPKETPDPNAITLTREELNKINADREADRLELSRVTEELHTRKVKERIGDLERRGFVPVVLKEAKAIYLADKASKDMITLSEDDTDVKLSASDIVDRILDALPEETLLKFSEIVKNTHEDPKPEDVQARIDAEIKAMRG